MGDNRISMGSTLAYIAKGFVYGTGAALAFKMLGVGV
jgi:hypothetical protein